MALIWMRQLYHPLFVLYKLMTKSIVGINQCSHDEYNKLKKKQSNVGILVSFPQSCQHGWFYPYVCVVVENPTGNIHQYFVDRHNVVSCFPQQNCQHPQQQLFYCEWCCITLCTNCFLIFNEKLSGKCYQIVFHAYRNTRKKTGCACETTDKLAWQAGNIRLIKCLHKAS